MDLKDLVPLLFVGLLVWVVLKGFLGKVAPDKAKALVKSGAKLVDVRSKSEHDAGHIPGSLHVPLQELSGRLAELGDKQKPVVVYCASGMRSASAASVLKKSGFAEVHDLGAMARWG